MPEKQDGPGLQSAGEEAIYQYLDEMLSDPGEGSGTAAPTVSTRDTGRDSSPKPSLSPVARAVASETPQTVRQPQPAKLPVARPLALKEKPEPRVLSNPESLLRFEKPIVVQQPALKEKTEVKPATRPETTAAEPVVQTRVEVKSPAVIEEPGAAEPVNVPEPEPKPETKPKPELEIEADLANDRLPPMTPWCGNGRPDWAQERFECLLFEVGGLKLAVPLVTLGAVHQIDRKFNELPGQYDWFIGILQTNLGNIKVIDTALCVMPERYEPDSRSELEYVITLHGFDWGISCHHLLKSITLEPEDVKWRSQRGKRPWMAGTVVEQMCALIDPAGFHHVILQAEKREK